MRVSMVVAAARNGVIGQLGEIPWRLPDDQRFFREVTIGHCVVMGRKTFDSLPAPLPDRKNLVLTREAHKRPNASDASEGVEYFHELAAALERARELDFAECLIAGGENIYREGMAVADRIYLTRVDAEPEGDTRFPEIDESIFECVDRKVHAIDDRHAIAFVFETWDRAE